jgi:hypothetical protein
MTTKTAFEGKGRYCVAWNSDQCQHLQKESLLECRFVPYSYRIRFRFAIFFDIRAAWIFQSMHKPPPGRDRAPETRHTIVYKVLIGFPKILK